MAAVRLLAAALHRLAAGEWPTLALDTWYLMLLATVFSTVIGGQVGEELGWRGYALPGLASRLGLARASIVLGILWAFWHLPLFYISGADTLGQSFPLYTLQVTGLSVAMAWVYGHTDGSLLLAMLMHSSLNNMSPIVPGVPRVPANPFMPQAPLLGWLTAAVIWVAAVYFFVSDARSGAKWRIIQ